MWSLLQKLTVSAALFFAMTLVPTTSLAQYVGEVATVRSEDGSLNIRSGAATHFEVTGVLQNDDLVVVREISGNWVRVSEPAGTGWVYASKLAIPSVIVMNNIIADNPDALLEKIKRSFDLFDGTEIGFYDSGVTDLSALSGLVELRKLAVTELTPLDWLPGGYLDLSTLAHLDRLEVLTLDEMAMGSMTDIGPLAYLTGLKELQINFADLSTIAPLADITGLQHLSLHRVGAIDIAPLAALTGLKSLSLSQMGVSDVTPLAELTALERLYLNGLPELRDVSPLANLTGLRLLDVRGSFHVDRSSLLGLSNLEIVDVR